MVAQLLDIFGFLSVLLRGLALSFEALTIGGIIFSSVVLRSSRGLKLLVWSAALLAGTEIVTVGMNSAILVGTTGMSWADAAGAGFCIAGALIVTGAMATIAFAHTRWSGVAWLIAAALILTGSMMNSHSFGRLAYRAEAMAFTVAHHVAAAAWIGGMLYVLIALRYVPEPAEGARIVSRFSRMAVAAVSLLFAGGAALSLLYVGSPAALTGTTYGIMLSAKVAMTGIILLLGGLNLKIVRLARTGIVPSLLPLRRFAEAELGIGFTVLLSAASLTSTPPAIDVRADLVAAPEIGQRMRPKWPSMRTPALSELSPVTPLAAPDNSVALRSFVPGQVEGHNTAADIAWSEYNHHWAGLVVLSIGILSLLARRMSWARAWPLLFFLLAAFLFLRADSENWPLGPRGFWESFQVAEVAQHRVFVLLIVLFAIFEWKVQTGRISPRLAGLVFPLVCAVGGALLLTHSHSLGNVKDEYFAELSHIPLAILAVVAGWSRWLEIRLPGGSRERLVASVWPACFFLIGVVLMCYREI